MGPFSLLPRFTAKRERIRTTKTCAWCEVHLLHNEHQELQGERAEQFVLSYEAKRLEGHPTLSKIKQISVIDVTAGYDILSYNGVDSEKLDRFIEVKSYLGSPHFYWSQNEIEKARLSFQ